MSRKYYKFKFKLGFIVAHVLTFLMAVGILCFSVSQCLLVTRDMKQLRFINPFDADVKYEETDIFADSFQSDAFSVISYLAVCRQFETDGVFDPDKEVDILSYYGRKDPNVNIDSKGDFVYKVQDLISWATSYGFTTYDDNWLDEMFCPTDGVPISEKQTDLYELMNTNKGYLSGNEFSSQVEVVNEMEEVYENEFSAELEEYVDGTTVYSENDAVAEEVTLSVSQEQAMTMEEARGLFNEILISVASDLSYNYGVYQEQKDYFINDNGNFKFLYLPDANMQKAQDYFTNLEVKSWSDAKSKVKFFHEGLAAYVIIDMENGNTEGKSANVSASRLISSLNEFKYAFPNGGKLYLGVLEKDVEGFATYTEEDTYAQIRDLNTNGTMNINNIKVNVGWMLVLFLLSLILLLINTVLCGRNETDKEVHLIAFDYWYTEIAFAIACGVASLLVAGFVCIISALDGSSGTFIYHFFHDNYFMMIMVAYVAIADVCFLFFYNSLIRRIKAGCLWQGSMIRAMMAGVINLGKRCIKGVIIICSRANVLGKTILTFIPVFALIILHVVAGVYESGELLLLGLFFDAVFFFLFLYINLSRNRIIEGVERISGGELEYQVDTTHMYGDSLRLAEAVNNIGDGIREAVNQSMKDERMKADLITNVSHDIKTPLTSIINYVDLLKRENVQDETIRSYIEVLDNKSQRLKQLTEDLVEASKISSGNIVLNIEELNVVDLMKQALGEFGDKFEEKELKVVASYSENPCIIQGDSRRMWRIIDNLLGNVYKYSLEQTRVYIEVKDLNAENKNVSISIKNISKQALNIDADELTQRFIRGDISRSTEGSGLGLSIAKSLVEAQGGTFNLYLDGDLFKITIIF